MASVTVVFAVRNWINVARGSARDCAHHQVSIRSLTHDCFNFLQFNSVQRNSVTSLRNKMPSKHSKFAKFDRKLHIATGYSNYCGNYYYYYYQVELSINCHYHTTSTASIEKGFDFLLFSFHFANFRICETNKR